MPQAYLHGRSSDPATVGLRASGDTVEVRLDRPAADFPSIVSGPTFAVVPPGIDGGGAALRPGAGFVGSGAYVLQKATDTELTLAANDRYWAGRPAIGTVHLLTTLAGKSPVQAFQDGDIDYSPIGDYDAQWIRYDRDLGPALRTVPSAAVTYYGFDTSRPPFDDVRVRQAFAWAVDWKRIVELGSAGVGDPGDEHGPARYPGPERSRLRPEARSGRGPGCARCRRLSGRRRVPRGDPGRRDRLRRGDHRRAQARARHRREVRDDRVRPVLRPSGQRPAGLLVARLGRRLPGPNDFLGLLLSTGSSNDYGRWSSKEFDAAIAAAGAATDPTTVRAAFDSAEEIVQRDVPVVPLSYGTGYALARDGLLGATESGLGILRLAGLAWSGQ